MKLFFTILILSTFLFSKTFSQSRGEKDKDFKVALDYMYSGDFNKSKHMLEILHRIYPKDVFYTYYLAINYMYSYEDEKALELLEQVVDSKFDEDPELVFNLGRAYHFNEMFDKALYCYDTFQKAQEYLAEEYDVKRLIEECQNGVELKKTKRNVHITNLGKKINTKSNDFGPVVSFDEREIIFTSSREGGVGQFIIEDGPGTVDLFYEDVYISQRDKAGKWVYSQNIGTAINTSYHDAAIGLSPDGTTVYLYRNNNGGDIYYSNHAEDGAWTKPEPFSRSVNSDYAETHLSLSGNGLVLVFTSDRPDGLGGFDIYSSRRQSQELGWENPENLGAVINTQFNEETPFISYNGDELYFSSEGHNTIGGYDIFVSKYDSTKTWSKPENLGMPINTVHDDLFFSVSADNKHAYFSSTRSDSYGGQDIYVASMPDKKSTFMLITGQVLDSKNKDQVNVDVLVYDNNTGEKVMQTKSSPVHGSYSVFLPLGKDYHFVFLKKNYMFKTMSVETKNQKDFVKLVRNIEIHPIKEKSKELLLQFDYLLQSESAYVNELK